MGRRLRLATTECENECVLRGMGVERNSRSRRFQRHHTPT